MKTIVVTCFSDFLDKITAETGTDLIFRGVSDVAHHLVPSIGRSPRWKRMPLERLVRQERAMLKRFREDGAAYVDGRPNVADWMVLGHQHGLPGRLLAWSRSPLYALWFACQGRTDTAGALYVERVRRTIREVVGLETSAIRRIGMLVPQFDHSAIRSGIRRQTVYTVHPDPLVAYDSRSLVRLRISGKLKGHLKSALGRLGVGPAALFPGLDGVREVS